MKNFFRIGILFLLIQSASGCRAAQAAAQSSIDFQVFYDELSPYGNWIDNPDFGYVWVPDIFYVQPLQAPKRDFPVQTPRREQPVQNPKREQPVQIPRSHQPQQNPKRDQPQQSPARNHPVRQQENKPVVKEQQPHQSPPQKQNNKNRKKD